MRNVFETWEETTKAIAKKGLTSFFIYGDIIVMLISIGVVSIGSAIIEFFIGAPYKIELFLGFLVIYLTNFNVYMKVVRAFLILYDEVDHDEYNKRLMDDGLI